MPAARMRSPSNGLGINSASRAYATWRSLAFFTLMRFRNAAISELRSYGEFDGRPSPDVRVRRLEGSL